MALLGTTQRLPGSHRPPQHGAHRLLCPGVRGGISWEVQLRLLVTSEGGHFSRVYRT